MFFAQTSGKYTILQTLAHFTHPNEYFDSIYCEFLVSGLASRCIMGLSSSLHLFHYSHFKSNWTPYARVLSSFFRKNLVLLRKFFLFSFFFFSFLSFKIYLFTLWGRAEGVRVSNRLSTERGTRHGAESHDSEITT